VRGAGHPSFFFCGASDFLNFFRKSSLIRGAIHRPLREGAVLAIITNSSLSSSSTLFKITNLMVQFDGVKLTISIQM
jgi:hypothetical protein